MNSKMLFGTTLAGLTLLLTFTQPASAEHRDRTRYSFAARRHMDVLANRLHDDANEICWEMYRHYQHNPGYRETYREMYRVMKDAEHVHDLVHDGYHRDRHDVDHIASDLYEIDKLFHHIEGDIRNWRSSSRGYHGHDSHGDFDDYVHGRGYRDELSRKMRYFEQTLHHLMADYGVKSKLGEKKSKQSPPAPPGSPVPADIPVLQN